ncbi:L-xylulose reductase-like [Ylistrum balloti]|uniref:L-xylulose reductase-like n=1 Tax=Ylistrum balloti TaxID=509963 RepID=UPI0029059B61|nr:L-xylulose reductase-like [Ylistrum balloti]
MAGFSLIHSERSVSRVLAGKKAIVTGAGRGIGRVIAHTLYNAGARLTAVSKTKDNLERLRTDLPGIDTICVNLRDWEYTRQSLDDLPSFDILVNNAGFGLSGSFTDMPKEVTDNMIDMNIKGMINVTQVIGKGMVAGGRGGSIVNVSSMASHRSLNGHTVYAATKAAIDAITRNLAREFAPHGIRVNSVNPTYVSTDMTKHIPEAAVEKLRVLTPTRKLLTSEEVAEAVLFLVNGSASSINGVNLLLDGGYTAT